MARGVRSSGSTLMPPVQTTMSAPRLIHSRIASVVISALSSLSVLPSTSIPCSSSFAFTTGVNLSSIRPRYTSLPVVTIPAFIFRKGRIRKTGSVPQISFTRFIFSSSITSGTTRMPAILSPLFTGKSPWREASTICPRAFTAFSFSRSIFRSPSTSAVSSIFPSFGSEAFMWLPWHTCRRISAASFSWSMPSCFSHT